MITKKDIQNLADLSRIKIDNSEAESLTSQIDSILEYVKQIEDVPVNQTEEILVSKNIMREDRITHEPNQYTEALLSSAPSREKNQLKVKKILQ